MKITLNLKTSPSTGKSHVPIDAMEQQLALIQTSSFKNSEVNGLITGQKPRKKERCQHCGKEMYKKNLNTHFK